MRSIAVLSCIGAFALLVLGFAIGAGVASAATTPVGVPCQVFSIAPTNPPVRTAAATTTAPTGADHSVSRQPFKNPLWIMRPVSLDCPR